MALRKAKLFWKPGDNDAPKEIFAFPYDDKVGYRSFVKELQDQGYRQAIVTSEIMIQIILAFALEHLRIQEIETIEDDEELQEQINELLDRCYASTNPAWYGELIEQLDSLAESSLLLYSGLDSWGVLIVALLLRGSCSLTE